MSVVNTTVLIGRIGSDISLKKTQNGKSVLQISLAVKRTKDITDWLTVVIWNQSADYIAQYAKKGDLIAVVGSLQTRSYESNGQRHTVVEIHTSDVTILSHSDKQNTSNGGNPSPMQNQRQTGGNEPFSADYITPEDLPF